MRWVLWVILSVQLSFAFGQPIFDQLTVDDGLSQNSINDIYQDTNGFMWFATQDGLNRYDGYEFVQYNTDGDLPLPDNFVWDINEDSNGAIWVGSRIGAIRLDWKNGKSTQFFNSLKKDFQNQIIDISIIEDSIFISYTNGELFRIKHDAFENEREVVLSKNEAFHLERPHTKSFVLAIQDISNQRLIFQIDRFGLDSEFFSFPEGFTISRAHHSILKWENGFFLGTEQGLLFFDLNTKRWESTPIQSRVGDLAFDKFGRLLVATNSGVIVVNPDQRIVFDDETSKFPNESVLSLEVSKDGLVWAGNHNTGVKIYDYLKDRFQSFGEEEDAVDPPIWAIFQYGDTLLFGADDGLYRLLGDKIKKVEKINHPLLNGKLILTIEKISSTQLLVGTVRGGLILYDLGNQTFAEVPVEKVNGKLPVISAISVEGEIIFVSTYSGLLKFDRNLNQLAFFTTSNSPELLNSNYLLTSFVSSDGGLWLGHNFGITLIKNGRSEHFVYNDLDQSKSPGFNFVSGFYEDRFGKIWMSTFGGGVSRLDRLKGTFTHFKKSDGLANSVCTSIEGMEDEIWVSHNAGVSRISILTGQITNFTTSDGLSSKEFAMGASFKNDFGQLFFGSVSSLIAFDPKDFGTNKSPPKPSLSSLSVNYESRDYGAIGNQLNFFPDDKIFTFSFSHFSYRNNSSMGYEYLMEGFDDQWVFTNSKNRRATYSLKPGNYIFKVRTVRNNQRSESYYLPVVVHPSFYQTGWFVSISILFLMVSVILISRYFSHRKLKSELRKLEVLQKVQNERERISRDLHDNVGAQITYIASSIDNLSSVRRSEELEELGEYARDTMRQLRETIWVINKDEVTLEELKEKVVTYFSEILKYRERIVWEVNFPNSQYRLNPTYAISIFRLIQEAVNNAVKHADPESIFVEMTLGKHMTLTITDDGKGFDGKDKMGHFGLTNMRARAAEMGGQLELIIAKDVGTRIEISGIEIGQMS